MSTPKKEPTNQPALAVSIPEAAAMVGLGVTSFYAEFLEKRIRPVSVGSRKLIVVEELRRAFDLFVLERRAAEESSDGSES